MKRLLPLIVIAVLGIASTMMILPGCDELVTEENFYYDTNYDTTYIYEADTTCGLCHTDVTDSITIASRQWAFSGHASDTLTSFTYLGSKTSTCGPECHTKEGFVDYIENGSASAVSFATEIGCFACHSPHTTHDFSLRTENNITLESGDVYDRNLSNICAHCHKSTLQAPTASATTVAIDSTWGPHFGVQADMLRGTGGYEFTAPLAVTNAHYSQNTSGCLGCHQDAADNFTLGGHSNKLEYAGTQFIESCNSAACHNSAVTDFYTVSGLQATMADSLDTTLAILIDSGWVTAEGLPIDSTIDRDPAGAVFNYLFISADGSGGVHNLAYAKELIDSTLVYLRTGVVPGSK